MNLPVQKETGFFLLLAAGVLAFLGLARPPSWYLDLILLAALGIVLYRTRTWNDRGFYLTCAGQPLVIALAAVQIWAGLFCIWMLAGIVLSAIGMLESSPDQPAYGIFCGAALGIAVAIDAADHVLLPLVLIGILVAVFALAFTLRAYRFRKQYAGASP